MIIDIILFIFNLCNIFIAIKDKNIHSAMGWVSAMILYIVIIIIKHI